MVAETLSRLAMLARGYGFAKETGARDGRYRGYDMPSYRVERRIGAAEVRFCDAHLVAEVRASGPRDAALSQGFGRLVRYILGDNASGQEVAMTVPVTQRAVAGAARDWSVTFAMPPDLDAAALPRPDDPRVTIARVPAERRIALGFSGRATEARTMAKAEELRRIAQAAGLAVAGPPVFLFYDDPFTLPWNRRNEVAFSLADGLVPGCH